MRLTADQLRMNGELADLAARAGWTVYVQHTTPRQRQHAPSMILHRGDRLALVYLRSGRLRPERLPDLEPLERIAGAEVHVWLWPADRGTAREVLR